MNCNPTSYILPHSMYTCSLHCCARDQACFAHASNTYIPIYVAAPMQLFDRSQSPTPRMHQDRRCGAGSNYAQLCSCSLWPARSAFGAPPSGPRPLHEGGSWTKKSKPTSLAVEMHAYVWGLISCILSVCLSTGEVLSIAGQKLYLSLDCGIAVLI